MLKGLIQQFMQTSTAMAVTILSGNWAIHYAYENRGYEAVGGEYLFIPFVYLSVYAGSRWLLDILEEIHCRRKEERKLLETHHDDKGEAGRC